MMMMWETLPVVTIVTAHGGERPMSVTVTQETTSSEHMDTLRKTRVDAPHVAHGDAAAEQEEPLGQALLEVAAEPTPSLLAAVAGETLESRREQLQLQVSQLAGHLRERLREVDRRESAINARVSQLEADLRTSRLWLRERENEFQQREQELRQQIDELEERLVPLAQNGRASCRERV